MFIASNGLKFKTQDKYLKCEIKLAEDKFLDLKREYYYSKDLTDFRRFEILSKGKDLSDRIDELKTLLTNIK